jgi:hypothetical protein
MLGLIKLGANIESGKYWKPGSLYYGKKKRSENMSGKRCNPGRAFARNGTGE